MKVNKICLAVLCGLLFVGCGGQSGSESKEETKTSEKEESTNKIITKHTYYEAQDGDILIQELDSRRAKINDPNEPMAVQPEPATEDKIRYNSDKIEAQFERYLPDADIHSGTWVESNLLYYTANDEYLSFRISARKPRYQVDIDELIDPSSRYGDEINTSSQVYKDNVKPIFYILQAITNDPDFVVKAEQGWLDSSEGLMTTYRKEDGLFITVKSEFDDADNFEGISIKLGYNVERASKAKDWENKIELSTTSQDK